MKSPTSNPPKPGSLSGEKLSREIERIRKLSFADDSEEDGAKKQREKALSTLRRTTSKMAARLDPQQLRLLTHCSVKLLIHFRNVVRVKKTLCDWRARVRHRTAAACFSDLLRLFVPEREDEILRAVLDAMRHEDLFGCADSASELLDALVAAGVPGFGVLDELWNLVEERGTPSGLAKDVVRSVYGLMDSLDWPRSEETALALHRLLGIFRSGIGGRGDGGDSPAPFASLRKGLKVCLQRALEHLPNEDILIAVERMCSWSVEESIRDEDVLEFGSSLEYAAFRHESGLFQDTFTPEILRLLSEMIASPSRLVSLLGNRVTQHLVDRAGNAGIFETPQIFFEDTRYDFKVARYSREDKSFLRRYRARLHDSFIKGILNHGAARLNLETSYRTICLLAVEVPCGFTAAAIVCLVMNLQDLTMERDNLRREVAFHIHATVVAVLSLLCWVHGAKVFYQYVNKIVMERARWAPHLNPPIQSHYYFAAHHVLWDKPELFFVDWEARYGLWKCFRLLDS
ncbi:uncharacterized protein LOC125499669 isoform X2 [Athalia rosae]|uniref:uncharacterized protein LOC125499669 isoform X2 n=1 Tax=Athalia rosae TaxID=37344 RepID=UPI0020346118|nr:uncharacterized protein LOC125499669 isoform X2 [Athalia rosae]